jgi:DoxX-like family
MFTAYVAVTVLAAAANAAAAAFDFRRSALVIGNMATLGIQQAWLFPLGALKAAGALGLLAGIGVPLLGVAAAAGLVLFFVGAVIIHVHAGEYRSISYPGTFLLLAVGSLALRLASS